MTLEERIVALEEKVDQLQEEVELAQVVAAVKRGQNDADNGRFAPAREVCETLRRKYNIPVR